MRYSATVVMAFLLNCAPAALGDEATPVASEAAMRFVNEQKQARVAELTVFLKAVSANARQSGDVALVAKKKATLKEIRGLKDGSLYFVPKLPTVEEASKFDADTRAVGQFQQSENRFLITRVIGADTIEARQVIPTISIVAVGAQLRQGSGGDKLGSVARFTGISAGALTAGSEVRLNQIFEVVGRAPSAAGGDRLMFSVVTIPKPSKQKKSEAKERALGAKNTKSKRSIGVAQKTGSHGFPDVADKPQVGGGGPKGSDK